LAQSTALPSWLETAAAFDLVGKFGDASGGSDRKLEVREAVFELHETYHGSSKTISLDAANAAMYAKYRSLLVEELPQLWHEIDQQWHTLQIMGAPTALIESHDEFIFSAAGFSLCFYSVFHGRSLFAHGTQHSLCHVTAWAFAR
jgi:hypothetical protein